MRTLAPFCLSLGVCGALCGASFGVGNCPCAGDLNTDGVTDGADLAVLLGAWGSGGGADLDGSGIVDGADLAMLLGGWGACEGPDNDQCAAADNIFGELSSTPFCTAAATTSEPPLSCLGASMGKDLWFRWEASHEGKLIIDTFGSDFDTMLALYVNTQTQERCLCPFVDYVQVVACNDDAAGTHQSRIEVDVVEDGSFELPCYTLRVGGYTYAGGPDAGSGTINIDFIRKGDRCDMPHDLPSVESHSVTGFTTEDTWLESDPTSCALNDMHDEWYRFEMPCDGTVTFSTCHSATNFDTTLAVFADCDGPQLACNDDSSDADCQLDGLNRKSKATVFATAGDVLLIRVSGYNGDQGFFRLSLDVDCVN